jgi:hypothetical protein
MSQDGLYDFYVDQNCGPQPEPDEPWIEEANKALDEFESGKGELPSKPEQTADAAALWGARANWANIRMLLEAMGIK